MQKEKLLVCVQYHDLAGTLRERSICPACSRMVVLDRVLPVVRRDAVYIVIYFRCFSFFSLANCCWLYIALVRWRIEKREPSWAMSPSFAVGEVTCERCCYVVLFARASGTVIRQRIFRRLPSLNLLYAGMWVVVLKVDSK